MLNAPMVDEDTGELIDEEDEEACAGERDLLKQLRDELRTIGGNPWTLTQKQVQAMSCEQIRAEIDATGAAIDAVRAQDDAEQPTSAVDSVL